MDKLLEEHLKRADLRGPLAETIRSICCFDFGPWVKPLRVRPFYTAVEMARAEELGKAIVAAGNLDNVGLYMITEDIAMPSQPVIHSVPRDQYARIPVNYHIGLKSENVKHGEKNSYDVFIKETHTVPALLFVTLFGAALSRFDPYKANMQLFKAHVDEVKLLEPDTEFSGTEALKAVFTDRALQMFFPGAEAVYELTADFIPTADQLEHMAYVYGKDLHVPELYFLQMLDGQRWYGESRLVREGDGAVYIDNKKSRAYILNADGVKEVSGYAWNNDDELRAQCKQYRPIPERFGEAILAMDKQEVVLFFGGEPEAPQIGGQLPPDEAGSFQLGNGAL